MGLFSFLGGLFGLSGAPSQSINISKQAASAGLPIIYGRRRVEALTVFKSVSKKNAPWNTANSIYQHTYDPLYDWPSGPHPKVLDHDENKDDYDWLHRIDVWGQGEIEGIERFWVDGESHLDKRFRQRPYFRALSLFGKEDQPAMSELIVAAPRWSNQHYGKGVAYSWTRFFNSDSKPQFRSEPEVAALVQGIRLFDPRDVTQSYTDPSTWGYSRNRALGMLNYLMASYGFGAAEDEIDLESFKVAAALCDEEMDIPPVPTNQTGGDISDWWDNINGTLVTVPAYAVFPNNRTEQVGTTQARWEVDAVLDPKKGVVKNVKTLLEGMGWALPWSNGKHKLVLEWTVNQPVMTFDANNIIGNWTIERGMRTDRLNRVTVEFNNANKEWEEDTVSWPALDSAEYTSFLAQDQGQSLHTNIRADSITDFYRAQAWAEYKVRKSRVAERIKGLKLAPEALLLEPGDVIALDYPLKGYDGDANAWFIVERVSVSPVLDVTVDLIKYDVTVYCPDCATQEPVAQPVTAAALFGEPPAVENLAADDFHEAKADGTMISGFDISWDMPERETPGISRIQLDWREHDPADAAPYGNSMNLPGTALTGRISGLQDNKSYDIRLTYWTQRGQQSAEAVLTAEALSDANSRLTYIEDNATYGATIGVNVYDEDGFVIAGDEIITADGQLAFRQMWNFDSLDLGWTVSGATLSAANDAIHISTTNTNAQLISPTISINGANYNKVAIRMRRTVDVDEQYWEFPVLFYKTSGHGFSQSFKKTASRRFSNGVSTTFVFDMGNLTFGGDDWLTNIITQIRFDPSLTPGDEFNIEWIGIGRVTPAAEDIVAGNLVDDLGFTEFSAANTGGDDIFSTKTLDQMGLIVGNSISVGLEIIATGTRRGKLALWLMDDADNILASPESLYAAATGQYERVAIEGYVIPPDCTKIRFRFHREDDGAGIDGDVGARRLSANSGSLLAGWSMARPDVESGATNGATIGTNITDLDGIILQEDELRTADGQLTLGPNWDFRGDPLGWSEVAADITGTSNGVVLTTQSGNAQFISPSLAINGGRYDKVIVRMKRVVPGQGDFFDNPVMFYRTASHGFSSSYRKGRYARFGDNNARTIVFDMTDLTAGGNDWVNNTITQLRFDPSTTTGDGFELDWIGVGRVSAPASEFVAANLADELRFEDFGPTDTNIMEVFGKVELADVGLAVGDMISAGCEIISTGDRRGQLEIIFEKADATDIEALLSPWSVANMGTYQSLAIENRVIPPECAKIRFRLQREDGVALSGAVGARRATLNRGAYVLPWYPVRDDVEANATNGAPMGTLVGATAAEDVESQAQAGYDLTQDNATQIHPSSLDATIVQTGVGWITMPADGATMNRIYRQTTQPSGAVDGDIWVDTSGTTHVTKVCVSGSWQVGANHITDTNQLIDSANLGSTANWSQINNDNGNRPADGATKTRVFRDSTAPSSPLDGDIWVDTSITPNTVKVRVSGAWQNAATYGAKWGVDISGQPTSLSGLNPSEGAKLSGIAANADVTANNIAQGIASQGDLATKSQVNTSDIVDNAASDRPAATEKPYTEYIVNGGVKITNDVTVNRQSSGQLIVGRARFRLDPDSSYNIEDVRLEIYRGASTEIKVLPITITDNYYNYSVEFWDDGSSGTTTYYLRVSSVGNVNLPIDVFSAKVSALVPKK